MPSRPTRTPATRRVENSLAVAFERVGSCPPLTALVECAGHELDEQDALRIQRHAAECASCAAEIEASVELLATESTAHSESIARLVDRLATAPRWLDNLAQPDLAPEDAAQPGSPPIHPETSTTTPLRKFGWALALAAGLLLAVSLSLRTLRPMSPPDLPGPVSSEPRGAVLHLSFPLGELSEQPRELRWENLMDAALYRAEVRNIAGTVLHTCAVAGEPLVKKILACSLPASTSLMPGVRYSWRVSAFQEANRNPAKPQPPNPIATSPWIDFSYTPATPK